MNPAREARAAAAPLGDHVRLVETRAVHVREAETRAGHMRGAPMQTGRVHREESPVSRHAGNANSPAATTVTSTGTRPTVAFISLSNPAVAIRCLMMAAIPDRK